MATFTTNYNLRKPGGLEYFNIGSDFNANWDTIDTQIKNANLRIDTTNTDVTNVNLRIDILQLLTGAGINVLNTTGVGNITDFKVNSVTKSSIDTSGAFTGNAASATKLATGRTIAITGDTVATGVSFDGTGNISLASNTNKMFTTDNRAIKPNATSAQRLSGYFTSLEGLTGVAGTNYQDLLVLNHYTDATGGQVNALAFDKDAKIIRHYLANQTDATWGTPKTLAYAEDVLPLVGGVINGTLGLEITCSTNYKHLKLGGTGIPLIKFANANYNAADGAELWQANDGTFRFNIKSTLAGFSILADGKIAIGNHTPVEQLDVAGNVKISGNITNGTNTLTVANAKTAYDHSQASHAYLPLAGGVLTGRLDLKGGSNVSLSFYNSAYYTWIESMTQAGAGNASTGGVASSYGDVTSWARRSTIENPAGYGWIWDSCANTLNAAPDPKMALSSASGNLRVKGEITATKVWGAVYNDYAEFRQSKEDISLGEVVIEGENGHIVPCKKRLSKAPMVISDTHGFGIGEQDIEGEYSLPIAVAGRALVYTDKNKDTFKVGDVVCSGTDGTISKMKWWEKIIFPERILGTVSEIPTYEEWGTDKIQVNNRIWIRI